MRLRISLACAAALLLPAIALAVPVATSTPTAPSPVLSPRQLEEKSQDITTFMLEQAKALAPTATPETVDAYLAQLPQPAPYFDRF